MIFDTARLTSTRTDIVNNHKPRQTTTASGGKKAFIICAQSMPSLTIKPPRPPSEPASSSPAPPQSSFTFLPPTSSSSSSSNPYHHEASSPVAPDYSPITPKVQPALPATLPAQHAESQTDTPATAAQPTAPPAAPTGTIASSAPAPATAAIPPTQYISPPPPQPFSSHDSTDAIALRSAISALQFQRKKAQDDIRTLESTRKQALDDPLRFRNALAAGRLKEQRPDFGGLQAILDAPDSDEEEEEEEEDGHAILGASREDAQNGEAGMQESPREVPDSQSSPPLIASSAPTRSQPADDPAPAPFARIPGAQNVVRMPRINWDKYHIVGEPLDAMHEQQRRWPGSSTAFLGGEQGRGREFAVAAPYSPFYDTLDGGQQQQQQMGGETAVAANVNVNRKDSVALATPTAIVSEHPMETRRSSKQQ